MLGPIVGHVVQFVAQGICRTFLPKEPSWTAGVCSSAAFVMHEISEHGTNAYVFNTKISSNNHKNSTNPMHWSVPYIPLGTAIASNFISVCGLERSGINKFLHDKVPNIPEWVVTISTNTIISFPASWAGHLLGETIEEQFQTDCQVT